MNVNQMINMVVRMILNRVMRSGMDAVSKRMSGGDDAAARKTTQRGRQVLKIGRKMGRF
ncbi:MAG: hypothetical protein KBT70_10985 [Roseovarius sp.]|uniref:hypothetical protein n=1 Tax=Roseovarius sp. TaxID=1486281 RepID=UPI001B47888A|nr:hypothetical protein [Roseovarius sp.]MBQ0750713.1 hypothetical protein [Roseovarius sp.]MBQ0811838.1 hypothetical protein [Roseovarius sp.]